MNPYSMDPSFNPPGIVSSSAIAPLMLRLWSLDCQWHIAAWHHLVLGVPRGSDLNPQNLFMTVGNSSIKNGIYTFIIYHISYYTYIYIIWYMYIWYELWKMSSSAFSSKDLVWWCVMFFSKNCSPILYHGHFEGSKAVETLDHDEHMLVLEYWSRGIWIFMLARWVSISGMMVKSLSLMPKSRFLMVKSC